jgi:hypothetical protein
MGTMYERWADHDREIRRREAEPVELLLEEDPS